MASNQASNDRRTADLQEEGHHEEEEEAIAFENRCGLMQWRPDCLQILRSIYLFLATLGIVCILQTAISAGYMSSQITTIERRFSMSSNMLGFIQSFFDLGFIISVVFVSYFGSQGRKPLWIGFGMLIMSTGALSFSLPEFIAKYNDVVSVSDRNLETCVGTNSSKVHKGCKDDNVSNWLVKFLFFLGQILIGSGSSPILSLAPTYIDDHVPETLAPPLIAVLYACTGLGPVIGFGLGAVMLQYPSDTSSPRGSKPGDHNWIGAWWLGYVFLGIMAALIAFFLFMFPRQVRKVKKVKIKAMCRLNKALHNRMNTDGEGGKSKEPFIETKPIKVGTDLPLSPESMNRDKSTHGDVTNSYGKNIKDMPKAILSLLRNRVYVVVTLAICCEMFLVNGFASFLPKYIEDEYKVSNITASLIVGGIIVPAGALGIISGGLIMHRFQMSRQKAVLFSIVCVLLVLGCLVMFFVLSCNNPPFAGINIPIFYNGTQSSLNIINTCNSGECFSKCNPNIFSPICDSNSGVTFFSSCFAGCSNFTLEGTDKVFFNNCLCTSVDANLTGSSILTLGECPLKCNSLISFLVFLTSAIFLTGITQNPLFMVTMRSVEKQERSFALGFQYVILRMLAYIPSPIIYGSVIDAACVHWKQVCGARGDCLVSDLKLLTYYLVGLSFSVKCGAAIFYVILFIIIRRPVERSSDPTSSREL